MDAPLRRLIPGAVVASAAAAVAAGALDARNTVLLASPAPEVLQARYDAARDAQERAYARGDGAAASRAYRDVLWAERHDSRPAGWRGTRDVPLAPKLTASRAEKGRDERVAARLAQIARVFRGETAFWYHDLRTGRAAGWNAETRFPAASLVKLGVIAAALRASPRPERSPLWYDLRQLAGWSSNLAANRIVRKVGGERVVQQALTALGARASTYPAPYRAGTAATVQRHWRVTTAHDLGRMLYSFHAAASGNRYVARRSGLSPTKARLALALLAAAHPRGDPSGLVRPFVPLGTAVARKEGWISDFRGTAAIVYGRSPKILVVLVHRPGVTLGEARSLARRAVRSTLP